MKLLGQRPAAEKEPCRLIGSIRGDLNEARFVSATTERRAVPIVPVRFVYRLSFSVPIQIGTRRKLWPGCPFMLALVLIWVLGDWRVAAHDPGLSSLEVRPAGSNLVARMFLAPTDARLLWPDRSAAGRNVETLTQDAIELEMAAELIEVSSGEQSLPLLSFRQMPVSNAEDVGLEFVLPNPVNGSWRVHVRALAQLARGHRQVVSFPAAEGLPALTCVLDRNHDTVDLPLGMTKETDAGSLERMKSEMALARPTARMSRELVVGLGALFVGLLLWWRGRGRTAAFVTAQSTNRPISDPR